MARAGAGRRTAVRPTMATLFTLVFALGGWRSGLGAISDNSFLWHLQTGRQILEDGIPRADPYSFSAPGVRWVAQSWLAELVYGLLDRVGGVLGVRLLTAAIGAVVATACYRLALRLARDRVRAAGITLAAVGTSFTLWSPRPLFFGVLAFVCLLWVVEVPDSRLGRRPLLAVPVLMWLWANAHGTFALGFVYLALHLGGRWLDGHRPWEGREGQLAMATVLAVAVGLVNPYGPALLLFPLELLGRGDVLRNVVEWGSPSFRSIQGLMLAGWILVFALTVARAPVRPSRRDLLVTIPFLLLALWALRNIALAPLVGLPVVARLLATPADRPETPGLIQRPVVALLAILALVWTVEATGRPDLDLDRYPVEALAFIEDEGLLGKRLMTDDAWAGYVIFRYWPEQQVFLDDRYDMYPLDVIADYDRFAGIEDGWDEVLDRHRIDVVVWQNGGRVNQLLEQDPDWQAVHEDDLATVYVRT